MLRHMLASRLAHCSQRFVAVRPDSYKQLCVPTCQRDRHRIRRDKLGCYLISRPNTDSASTRPGLEFPLPKGSQDLTGEGSLLDLGSWQDIGDTVAEEEDRFAGVSLERGKTGVFDIEEFVDLLRRERLDHIAVIAIPPQIHYVDYMVITTGRSAKQMAAVAEFVRTVFKKRCLPSDSLPVIEGKGNQDWIALDLGNIALHMFSAKTRIVYDLETLWTCGAKYDDLSNADEDSLAVLMKKHSFPVDS